VTIPVEEIRRRLTNATGQEMSADLLEFVSENAENLLDAGEQGLVCLIRSRKRQDDKLAADTLQVMAKTPEVGIAALICAVDLICVLMDERKKKK
jgi:hypothetical protein